MLKNDASFQQEITRTFQIYRRQNQSACPAFCAFLSRRARLLWHAQKICAVTIVGTVLQQMRKGFRFLNCSKLNFLFLEWSLDDCMLPFNGFYENRFLSLLYREQTGLNEILKLGINRLRGKTRKEKHASIR